MLTLGLILLIGGLLIKLLTSLSPVIAWVLVGVGVVILFVSFFGKKK